MKNQFLKFAVIIVSIFCSTMIYSTPINQYINTVSPSQNAVSVIKSSNITIVFTQDMNPATINNANIKVFGYQTGLLPVTVDYNVAGKTANINPNQDLKAGEKISVTLTSGITTVTNENITPFVYTFYVKATGGNSIFTRTSEITVLSHTDHPAIKSGDIDMDGDIDLVIDNRIYFNNGNALFSLNSELSEFGHSELADFDNDGDLDILIQNGNNVYFYQNNGLGVFVQTSMFTGGISTFGDLNGDGFLDISYLSSVTNLVTLKNIQGNFFPLSLDILNTGCIEDYTDNVLIDDMDNDGDMDIIAINGERGGGFQTHTVCRNFNLLSNSGQGIFNSQIIYNAFESAPIPFILSEYGTTSSDFNNDGFVDLASPDVMLYNNGNNSFSSQIGTLSSFCNSLNSDFTGDGFFDLVITIPGAPLLSYLNDQSGNLTQFQTTSGGYFGGNASGDFDNDGDIDIAFGDYGGNTVGILLNGDIPLPVELSSFTSETELNNVTLNWSTSSEENNAGYDIEKTMFNVQSSMFNENWSKAGFVNGNGNTNNMSNYTFTDKNLQSGKYKYRLKQTDFNGNFKYYELSNEVSIGIPDKFYLTQNYPNPFNPTTNLGFGISELGFASLKVYDSQGKEVATLVNENKAPGYYNIQFDGSKLSSGVYYYRLESKGFSQTKRMMLLK